MRSQPPSMISIQEAPLSSSKNVDSILSPSSSPISSSESGITINRQRISPSSKCAIWKQKNEVKLIGYKIRIYRRPIFTFDFLICNLLSLISTESVFEFLVSGSDRGKQ